MNRTSRNRKKKSKATICMINKYSKERVNCWISFAWYLHAVINCCMSERRYLICFSKVCICLNQFGWLKTKVNRILEISKEGMPKVKLAANLFTLGANMWVRPKIWASSFRFLFYFREGVRRSRFIVRTKGQNSRAIRLRSSRRPSFCVPFNFCRRSSHNCSFTCSVVLNLAMRL